MRRALTALAVFAFGLAAAPLHVAAGDLEVVAWVDGRWRRGPVDARVGERVRLRVHRNGRPLPEGTTVQWSRVVAQPQHIEGHARGAALDDPTYTNAVLGGPGHGAWVGMDEIEYASEAFEDSAGVSIDDGLLTIDRVPPPPHRRTARLDHDAGTLFVAASIASARTPGEPDRDRLGLTPRVMRVSFRSGDDFLGWMSAFFDVPYVFGSTPRQSERRVGIDCADVMVAARRRETGEALQYTSVRGIARLAEPVSEAFVLDDGVTQRDGVPIALRWGDDVRPGDLLAVDYVGSDGELPRAWDHIVALHSDAVDDGERGLLDGRDVVRHMGRRGLTDGALDEHGTIRARVWRWR